MPLYKFVRQDIIRPEEFERLYEQCPGRYRAFLYLLYKTGARISELLKLTKADIEINDELLMIRIPTLKRKQRSPIVERRAIPIRANSEFIEYINSCNSDERLFKFSRATAWRILKKLDNSLSPHIFRHTRLQSLAEKGASEEVLRIWAGWSDSRPARNYIHFNRELIKSYID